VRHRARRRPNARRQIHRIRPPPRLPRRAPRRRRFRRMGRRRRPMDRGRGSRRGHRRGPRRRRRLAHAAPAPKSPHSRARPPGIAAPPRPAPQSVVSGFCGAGTSKLQVAFRP
jgi:hypothetical protein